jgi:amidohydrolase
MKKIIFLLFFVPFAAIAGDGDKDDLQTMINTAAENMQQKVVEWRRYIHEHPELGNRETQTAVFITNHLKTLGLQVQTNVAKTGVVALLVGGKPGPVVALRADMDALPVKERVAVPFASKVKADYLGQQVDVMHACGHDAHVAILMGVAEVLNKFKKDVPGTVKFIFQPAEEGPPGDEEGGASLMVKEGVMENPKVDVIFGLHISSSLEVGKIGYKSGSFMAAADWFNIKVKGKQAHGSAPWRGIDPIAVGAQIISGLQMIVSRQEDLTKAPVVITVGKINSGVRNNIIPEELSMDGTIRTLDAAMQKEVHAKMKLTAEKIAEANGATAEVKIDTKTLVTYNTPSLVTMMLPSLQRAANNKMEEMTWTTGAEDFSYYGEKAPAFFFNLGGMDVGGNSKTAPGHHTPDFYINEGGFSLGVKAFCNLVFDYAKLKQK